MPNAKTVLIVDDDRLLLATYRAFLVEKGHRVVVADNGKKALDFLQKVPADLALMDVLMPDADGLETLLTMRKRHRHLPIYIMSGGSARSKQDFLMLADRLGATGILRKPISMDVLLGLVEATGQVVHI